MKKHLATGFFLVMLLMNVCLIGLAQTPADFIGTWSLDLKKNQDLPTKVHGLTLVVTQREQRLVVESRINGQLKVDDASALAAPQPQALPTGTGASNSHLQGAAGGISEPGAAAAAVGATVVAHGTAVNMVIPRISYSLDGQETATHMQGARPSLVRRKMSWKEANKRMVLTVTREFDDKKDSVPMSVNERWQLLEGGKVLKVVRTVNTPSGWDKVTLFYNKTATS